VIRSFKDKTTEAVAKGNAPKGFPSNLVRAAQRKLFMIENAATLDDLRVPTANKLHSLKADRKGQHAIWINDQFRVCFRWTDAGAEDVEIVDYHD